MKPEEQRIEIAKCCGWRECKCKTGGNVPYGQPWNKDAWEFGHGHPHYVPHEKELPDYLNDLNAMRDAEKTLSELECERYDETLLNMEPDTFGCSAGGWTFFRSSAQRAEVFLKVKGLWKE